MTTLILGSSGFLGSYVSQIDWEDSYFHTTKKFSLDEQKKYILGRFSDRKSLWNFLHVVQPKIIINCIALANIEKCESNRESAMWLNAEIPRILAEFSASSGAYLVHFSTDAVLTGQDKFKSEEYVEKNTRSNYGVTKLLGENSVLSTSKNSLVLRVNFFGKSDSKNSLADFFIENLQAGNIISGFTNVFFTPIYARSLAEILKTLVKERFIGLYHLVGSDRISKYEFGVKIAQALNLNESLIRPKSSIDLSNADEVIRDYELSLSNNLLKTRGIQFNSLDQDIQYFTKGIRKGEK
jgi:dTDP-4-dehydrorhamnose reductase